MKHDDIVLSLTTDRLRSLFLPYFGKKGLWDYGAFLEKDEVDLNAEERGILDRIRNYEGYFEPYRSLQKLHLEAVEKIENLSVEKSVRLVKTLEFPLIKGRRQHMWTKGFIDLIVHIKPKTVLYCSPYSCFETKELIVEIKKEEDFNDIGQILRQIKEYRAYYEGGGVNQWVSCLTERAQYNGMIKNDVKKENRYYCLLSTKIPEPVKELFPQEGIHCFEIDQR